jgi:hypothetical protein
MWKHLKHYLGIGFTAGLIASLLYVLGVILLAVKATSALATVESYKVLYQNYFLIAGVLYLLVALYFAVKRETPEMCHCGGQPSHTHCPWICVATAIITAVVTYYLLMMVVVPYLTNMLTR